MFKLSATLHYLNSPCYYVKKSSSKVDQPGSQKKQSYIKNFKNNNHFYVRNNKLDFI